MKQINLHILENLFRIDKLGSMVLYEDKLKDFMRHSRIPFNSFPIKPTNSNDAN